MLGYLWQWIFIVFFCLGFLIRLYFISQEHALRFQRRTSDRGLIIISFIGMIFMPAVYLLTPWLDGIDYPLSNTASAIGVPLALLYLWLLLRSNLDQNGAFATLQGNRESGEQKASGIYRVIRHPEYAAYMAWGAAQAFFLHNWAAGLSMLAAIFILYAVRIPREERRMLAAFGEKYQKYIDETGRLLPRLIRRRAAD